MKTIIILMWLLWYPTEQKFIIINDSLYKMPDVEVKKIKTTFQIMDTDVIKFNFDTCNCYTSLVEWIKIRGATRETLEVWSSYKVETNPQFMYDEKFVGMEYFYPSDIESITLLPIDKAISKFGCKGLNPIFILKLKKGKIIQNKPVGGIIIRRQS